MSRQIFWGHRIPGYRYQDGSQSGSWIVARSEEEARRQLLAQDNGYGNAKLEQDEDVLDTWFSSALLPLSAMGWPQPVSQVDMHVPLKFIVSLTLFSLSGSSQQFEKHYPLSLMETGHDIIFLWVARMVMLGLELTDTLPFKVRRRTTRIRSLF